MQEESFAEIEKRETVEKLRTIVYNEKTKEVQT